MKRFSPAVLLAIAAACVILLDAVVVVIPQALADPNPVPSASPSAQSRAASATLVEDPSAAASAAPTSSQLPFFASVVVVPSPSSSPIVVARKTTPKPKYRDTVANARIYVRNRIGAKQYNCINIVWYHESRWSWRAQNPNSGAYGIPQAVPGNKMAAFGSNWRTSPLTQVKWGIWYVNNRYGSACGAYAFWSQHHWY